MIKKSVIEYLCINDIDLAEAKNIASKGFCITRMMIKLCIVFITLTVVIMDLMPSIHSSAIMNSAIKFAFSTENLLFYTRTHNYYIVSLFFLIPFVLSSMVYYVIRNYPCFNFYYTNKSYMFSVPNLKEFVANNNIKDLTLKEKYLLLNKFVFKKLLKGTVYAFVLFIVLSILDVTNYSIVTESGIENKKYFGISKEKYSWKDVKQVVTGCGYESEYLKYSLEQEKLYYKLILNNNEAIDIYSYEVPNKDSIRSLEILNAIIVAYKIPVTVEMYSGLLGKDISKERCYDFLLQKYGKEKYETVKRLLHLKL